nr:cytochrome c oxidase subunit 2 [Dendrobium nobile]
MFDFFRILEWRFLTIAPCDAAEPWQLGSQDAATPMMQGIIDLHHDIFFFLILILVFVSRMLVRALWHFHEQTNPIPQRIVHGTTIEILRTIFPSLILMFIAIPSFALLYSMDEVVVDPAITMKAIGHQWYRTYEYSDYNSSDEQSLTFDSYTIPEDDLELGQSRLLEVDNRVVVPAKTHLRMIVTPADVPHSWAVPSSGVKCDAVPGRSNQTSISVQREGVYYGQCSEIRGTNHAFMLYRRRSCSFERLWFSGIQSIPPPNRVSWSGKKIVGLGKGEAPGRLRSLAQFALTLV